MITTKVLFISVRADIGGGPKHLLDLLRNKPVYVKAYTAIPQNQYYSRLLQMNSFHTNFIPFRKFSLLSYFNLLRLIKDENIQVVHSHGRGAGIYSRLLKLTGVKVVHTFHGIHQEQSLISKIKTFVDQGLKGLTDCFICVSPSEKKKALSSKVCIDSKTKVIFNGVALQSFSTMRPEPIPQIAMLGRLHFQKGYDILIKYIDTFSARNPEYKFQITIAGDGEKKDELIQQLNRSLHAKKIIKFDGPTHEPLNFLNSRSLFLSFARFEGFPISVLEAMSVGKACLISNVTGNKDITNNNTNCALLFKLEDYNDFEEKFAKLITNEELVRNLSNLAYRTVRKRFSLENMAKETFKVINL